jgi:TolB-like protein
MPMRKIWLLALLVVNTAFIIAQEESITLNRAINNSMLYLTSRLQPGSKVVILNFAAPTNELSDYVIEELTTYIVNEDNLTVVDRRNLELLQQELNFQLSGDVDDETAQAIGKKVGAQTIISGSCTSLGEVYRMRVRAIKVETAEVQGQQTATIRMDSILAALLKVKYTDSGFSIGRKIGAGFMNPLMGLGSFTMGDWVGGGIVAAGYAIALGLIIYDIAALSYEDDLAGIPGSIGFGIVGATTVFGFIRPFIYRKPPVKTPLSQALDGIRISVQPDNTGVKAVRLSYTYRF